ncbi:hypothetical protein QM012_005067 [Aureobasidium pullulans]|uniref:Cation efflux protein cytoplasmic domain-containing protein n=1 Tax=Aureobasidium pullulans TaxID=5580 RepID=A0ABR0T6X0_AURPU
MYASSAVQDLRSYSDVMGGISIPNQALLRHTDMGEAHAKPWLKVFIYHLNLVCFPPIIILVPVAMATTTVELASVTSTDIELQQLQGRVVETPDITTLSQLLNRKTRQARTFHKTQNEHIARLVDVARDPTATRIADDRPDKSALHVKAAIYFSIYGTILVAGLQIYAAVSTLSLSLFVTMAESCCEAISNIGLNYLHRKSKKLGGSIRWPAGAERLSNAGNICFAFALMAVSLVLVVESIRALASDGHELNKFHIEAIIAAAIGFGIKLFLAIYCFIFRKHSSQLEMLWEDNRNDCFEYGFAIFTSAAGAKLKWWVDPAGAMLIACVIITTWIATVRSEFLQLCGLGAPANVVQELIFITLRHSDLILKVDSANAYHWGEDLFVEVDIVMSPDCSLRQAHDVSQALQDKLETVEGVARAFVHVDYETSHSPEHRKTR